MSDRPASRWRPPRIELGPHDGRLAPCPRRPNCVCSFADDAVHGVEAIRFEGEAEAARARCLEILASWARCRVVVDQELYLRAECHTLLGFVDDLELLVDPETSSIHVRSASRVGYRDFGVNRRRVERLRRALG